MTIQRHRKSAYTLVEVLIAATLTLMLMGAVVTVFSSMGNGINNSRAALETFDRLRATAAMLRNDLDGVTVTMQPPRRPEANEGYFEIIEGPRGLDRDLTHQWHAVNSEATPPTTTDYTVEDNDDILMFTTRSTTRPFSGRCSVAGGEPIQSDVAEVAWFVRGRTLHRRVLLVVPNVLNLTPYNGDLKSFFQNNDISARIDPVTNRLVGNTLGDLTKRECRYGHPYGGPAASSPASPGVFPYDVRWWGGLGLPTLREWTTTQSSSWLGGWTKGTTPLPGNNMPSPATADYWKAIAVDTDLLPDYYLCSPDPKDSTRVADDVVLTNVIGFDVKVWEPHGNPLWQPAQNFVPGPGAYVDLGWMGVPYPQAPPPPNPYPFLFFHHLGDPRSLLAAKAVNHPLDASMARVYDTFSTHYENEGRFTDDLVGRATNGFDDLNSGIVDGANEALTAPPYPAPLRGIQIKIRVFEPDSRQIREVTIVQDFLPK